MMGEKCEDGSEYRSIANYFRYVGCGALGGRRGSNVRQNPQALPSHVRLRQALMRKRYHVHGLGSSDSRAMHC